MTDTQVNTVKKLLEVLKLMKEEKLQNTKTYSVISKMLYDNNQFKLL